MPAVCSGSFKFQYGGSVHDAERMKNARELHPTNSYQKMLQEYDLREIDAQDRCNLFCRKYMARLSWVLQTIQRELPPGSLVLEVGCSQANASLLLAEQGYRCISLDIRPEALKYARSKHTGGSFYPVAGSAERLPFASEQFNGVVGGELLEHCGNPEAIVRHCAEVVEPGGVAVFTTPNGEYVGCKEPRYDPNKLVESALSQRQFGPVGADHLFALTSSSLKQILKAGGLDVMYCGYVGSVIYSDKYFPLKRIMPVSWIDRLSRLVNHLPGLNRLLSYTLVAMARKP